MKSKLPLSKGRIKPAGTPLTEEKFQYYFESLKDLIKSESKSTQTILRAEMDEKFNMTWVAISEHTRLIKGLDTKVGSLDARMGGVEDQIKGLDTKIDSVRTELKGEIQGVRTELKDDMRQMEGRLSEKIDGHSARLDNHEIRISAIEQG